MGVLGFSGCFGGYIWVLLGVYGLMFSGVLCCFLGVLECFLGVFVCFLVFSGGF